LYFGVNLGEAYWRYYRYQDLMQQEAQFAHMRTDEAITGRLVAAADSLGLPDAARRVEVRRTDATRRIFITADYSVRVEFPGFVRTLHFMPRAEGTY
jgi:hypothetical protein